MKRGYLNRMTGGGEGANGCGHSSREGGQHGVPEFQSPRAGWLHFAFAQAEGQRQGHRRRRGSFGKYTLMSMMMMMSAHPSPPSHAFA